MQFDEVQTFFLPYFECLFQTWNQVIGGIRMYFAVIVAYAIPGFFTPGTRQKEPNTTKDEKGDKFVRMVYAAAPHRLTKSLQSPEIGCLPFYCH
jgi:hypothetical protein